MTRDDVNALCKALPGAEWSEPFGPGHDIWKVGGKIFAAMGTQAVGVSVKTPHVETAAMLIDAGVALKAPYFHRSWAQILWGAGEAEVTHHLTRSYDIVRASLAKKVQTALPARNDA